MKLSSSSYRSGIQRWLILALIGCCNICCTKAYYLNYFDIRINGGIDSQSDNSTSSDGNSNFSANDSRARGDGAKSASDGQTPPGTWVSISTGSFFMGSLATENCRKAVETRHQVTLTHRFEIQATEVTQSQFFSIMKYNPASFTTCGNNCPVDSVKWYEAAAYCNALSFNAGYARCYDCGGSGGSVTCAQNASYTGANIYACPGYRLPTEAEWEYAFRAGTTTAFPNNTNVGSCSSTDANANQVSWYNYNSGSSTHPVGTRLPNNWGIYDMAGNVFEFCNDLWDGVTPYSSAAVTDPWGQSSGTSYRVYRGGAWLADAGEARAAARASASPNGTGTSFGFRCVRTR